jgi:hypothetical protein
MIPSDQWLTEVLRPIEQGLLTCVYYRPVEHLCAARLD